jgi:hypothetical protein
VETSDPHHRRPLLPHNRSLTLVDSRDAPSSCNIPRSSRLPWIVNHHLHGINEPWSSLALSTFGSFVTASSSTSLGPGCAGDIDYKCDRSSGCSWSLFSHSCSDHNCSVSREPRYTYIERPGPAIRSNISSILRYYQPSIPPFGDGISQPPLDQATTKTTCLPKRGHTSSSPARVSSF